MNPLRDIRLRNKIILIVVVIGTVSTFTGNLINYLYEINKTKIGMIADSQMHARLISEYCSLPLEFNYPENAKDVLLKLAEINSITDGILYNSSGLVFAEYHRKPGERIEMPANLITEIFKLEGNFLHVIEKVQSKRGLEGYIYLRSEIDWKSIMLKQGLIAVILTLLMVLIIFALSFYFQKGISDPIIRLSNQVKHNTITTSNMPATGYVGKDEIGQLYHDFNLMIEQIQTRENDKRKAMEAEKIALVESKRLLLLADKSRNALLSAIEDQKMSKAEIIKLNETLEIRVKERTAQLEAVNKELETFTYSVSHDLKAPLRGIDGFSRLLQDIYGPAMNEEAQSFIKTIRSSTTLMNQLIDDLLNYSRLERSPLRIEAIRISEVIDTIVTLNKAELDAHQFIFETDSGEIVLAADSRAITIALRNVIENAIKFTKNRPNPRVKVVVTDNEQSWVISVADNGIGFNMKYHQRIFEIFQRLERAEDFPGTGIGLAMVSKAMQRMNGKVWAESAPGEGSVFYLEIPKHQYNGN
ncbi:MAG: GHKL domain-containing protein [Bacteroidetes bacterium]|nr:GHKL domain-containing protein [Bacteroidota bacterium]